MPPSAKLGWGTQESLPRTQPQGWGRQAGANIKENANLWAGSLDPEGDPGILGLGLGWLSLHGLLLGPLQVHDS